MICQKISAQENIDTVFNRSDSLRGYLSKYRKNIDVVHYDLEVKVLIDSGYIHGNNTITFKSLENLSTIQLDLFANLTIDSVMYDDKKLDYTREGNAFFITFRDEILSGEKVRITIYYQGKPIVSTNPPWDGGFVWEKDSLGRSWIAVACEGTGASLWWPNKDHLSDEPDSMHITVVAPANLMAISNGRLIERRSTNDGYVKWKWAVTYPINNYNVTLNIAQYTSFGDVYLSGRDSLTLDYYVLDYNQPTAVSHFQQVNDMLACFDHFLGKFPFWRDGYTLVETPYWGMEHQSCVAYGNNYKNNEYGFDFIIIHESAHEYWGNAVSASDHGELWIHESFATYMEALYIEYFQGKDVAIDYLIEQRDRIYNIQPILGPLHVNYNAWNDADMYFKGSWMLHSIRHTINDDEAWFKLIRDTFQQFKYQQIHSNDIINFMNAGTDVDLEPIFRQYLTKTEIPMLSVKQKFKRKGLKLKYKWTGTVDDFNMPVRIRTESGKEYIMHPTSKNQKILLEITEEENPEFTTDLFYFIVNE